MTADAGSMHRDFKSSQIVAVEQIEPRYPASPPFHPDLAFPEYTGPIGSEPNKVYSAIRQAFLDLGFDTARYGQSSWNPLGELIRPGDAVILKPNIVLHTNYSGDSIDSVITHGSVVRAVADYALKALQGKGKLVIGDAPVQQCKFDLANERSGLGHVVEYLRSMRPDLELHDLRLVSSSGSKLGVRKLVEGDPLGYQYIDLGKASEHHGSTDFRKLRVTNYDPSFMMRHHNDRKHEYIIANSVMQADVVISISKMKTHRKAGVSVTLKNLVGINGHKDCLPHHQTGSHFEGGDEYLEKNLLKRLVTRIQELEDVQTSSLPRLIAKIPKRLFLEAAKRSSSDKHFEGSWWGNDTIWRTVIDLNRILFFWSEAEAALTGSQQRRFLAVVDGVIAGEREGPLHPTAKLAGIVMAGLNPAAVDAVAARLMGFDWRKIKAIAHAMRVFTDFEPDDIEVVSSHERLSGAILRNGNARFFAFEPPAGWRGHVEIDSSLQ
jgi:uncharacterized protein (DUF362 family)